MRDDVDEYARGAKSMLSGRRGGVIGGNTGIYDSVSDTVGDIAHGARRGVEQGVDLVKDSSYGITSKLGSDQYRSHRCIQLCLLCSASLSPPSADCCRSAVGSVTSPTA
jgi:hypothetical protein